MVDNLTRPSQIANQSVDETTQKIVELQQKAGSMTKAGMAITAFGAGAAKALLKPVEATFATKKALGEVASVGVENLKVLEDAATEFSDKWSGTTKDQFITASYDIKSGISSLADEGVAEYTKLSALTAKATKATTAEMTSLFATGYGIYKGYYKNMSDIDFGKMFSAGIARSVQAFKTDGSKMSQAIQTLGASATTANVPLEEQLSILGMLQATMSGGEAGTKYKAFVKSAAKAGEELGISFVDTNKQLLSTPEILDKLRGKFGDTLDAAEKMQLQKAFGTEEAVAMIDLLYSKTGDLKGNITMLNGEMKKGTQVTEEMAQKMNQDPGARYQILQQQVQNLKEKIGNQLLPTVVEAMTKGSEIVSKMSSWVSKNKELIGTIGNIALKIAPVIMLIGIFITTIGAIGVISTKVALGVQKVRHAIIGIRSAIDTVRIAAMYAGDGLKVFGSFLMANPIFIVIGAVIALAAVFIYLWKTNEGFRNAVIAIWTQIKTFFGTCIEGIKKGFEGFVEFIKSIPDKFEKLKEGIHANMEALKNKLHLVLNSIKNVFINIFNSIKTTVMVILSPFVNGITNIFNHMKTGITNILNGLKNVMKGIWNAIKVAILGPVLLIIDLVTGDFKMLKSDSIKIINSLKQSFVQIWNGIKQIFKGSVQAIVGFVVGGFKNLKTNIITIWNGIKSFLAALWNGMIGLARAAWNGMFNAIANICNRIKTFVITAFHGILNFFTTLPSRLYQQGVGMITSLKNGISSVMSTVRGAITSGMSSAISYLTSLPSRFFEWGADMISGMVNGIKSKIGDVVDAVKGVGERIRNFLHFSVPDEGPLTDYESWMPDFMEGMASGIKVKAHVVTDKISDLAFNVREKMAIPQLNAMPQLALAGNVNIPKMQEIEKESRKVNSSFESQRSYKKINIKEIIKEQKRESEKEIIKKDGKKIIIEHLEMKVDHLKDVDEFKKQLEDEVNKK